VSTAVLFDKYYYSRPAFVDGTGLFHGLCREVVRAGSRILEVGPGPANSTSSLLASLGSLIGADVSEEAAVNPALEEVHLFDGRRLPFGDDSFDACVSNYVLEHVAAPRSHFREVARVLRAGGVYCFRTPNQWHYVPLASRLLPHALHLRWANRLRGLGGEAHDPYPTLYRANTAGAIRWYAREAGLEVETILHVEAEPTYGKCHPVLFYPMMLYERAVNATDLLARFRMNIVAALRKTSRHGGCPPHPRDGKRP
jgi:SAM-dependent methyltransferase